MLCLFLFNLGLDVIMTNLCSNSSSFKRCYGSNVFTFCTQFYRIINYVRTRNITLVDLQLDAQNSCLFTYNTFIKSSTCFEHYPAHLQEVYVVDYVDFLKMSVVMLGACRGF